LNLPGARVVDGITYFNTMPLHDPLAYDVISRAKELEEIKELTEIIRRKAKKQRGLLWK
jgi:hypothetical protein